MAVNILNATSIIGQTVAGQKSQNLQPYVENILGPSKPTSVFKVNTLNVFTTFTKRGTAANISETGKIFADFYVGQVLLNSELIYADRFVVDDRGFIALQSAANQSLDTREVIRGTEYRAENVADVFNWEQRLEIPDFRRKFSLVSKEQPLYINEQTSLQLKIRYEGVYLSTNASYNTVDRSKLDISYICSYEEIIT